MIRKILIVILCLTITSCIGFNSAAGLKFKTGEDRSVKLSDGTFVNFERPIGNCGVKVTFFGVILPVIPILFSSNSCEKSLDIDFSGSDSVPNLWLEANIKLKYNGVIYDPIAVEKLVAFYGKNGENRSEYGKKFKFKIDDFWKFRMADDKVIIIIRKVKDGQEFTEELPVKWGVMFYKNPSIPW